MTHIKYPVIFNGGCNCEAIRYTVALTEDYKLPSETNGICQCTKCRKFTGSLLPQLLSVKVKDISPPLKSNSAYKTYDTTKMGQRCFCSTCGSSLTFQYIAAPEIVELYIGTIDEDDLAGKRVGEEDTGQYGMKAKREGGVGHLLCKTEHSGSIYCENAVLGVTDNISGSKWWKEKENGKPFRSIEETGTK